MLLPPVLNGSLTSVVVEGEEEEEKNTGHRFLYAKPDCQPFNPWTVLGVEAPAEVP